MKLKATQRRHSLHASRIEGQGRFRNLGANQGEDLWVLCVSARECRDVHEIFRFHRLACMPQQSVSSEDGGQCSMPTVSTSMRSGQES